MADLSQQIKEFAFQVGFDLIGFASADEMNELAPEGRRPRDYLKEAKTVIVMGLRWLDPIVDGIPETRGIYSRMMWAINWQLDHNSYKLAQFLTKRGHITLPMPMGVPYSMERLVGMLSHKHAAVLAGLGEFGLNNLVLTPEYGPRQRFTSVLTGAKLDSSGRNDLSLCENTLQRCQRACVQVCPAGALDSALDMPARGVRLQGWTINKAACAYFMDRGLPKVSEMQYRCGLCVKACPVGSKRLAPAPLDMAERPV